MRVWDLVALRISRDWHSKVLAERLPAIGGIVLEKALLWYGLADVVVVGIVYRDVIHWSNQVLAAVVLDVLLDESEERLLGDALRGQPEAGPVVPGLDDAADGGVYGFPPSLRAIAKAENDLDVVSKAILTRVLHLG